MAFERGEQFHGRTRDVVTRLAQDWEELKDIARIFETRGGAAALGESEGVDPAMPAKVEAIIEIHNEIRDLIAAKPWIQGRFDEYRTDI